jgi:hypothetical protein
VDRVCDALEEILTMRLSVVIPVYNEEASFPRSSRASIPRSTRSARPTK